MTLMRDETLAAPDAVASCLAQDFSAVGTRLRGFAPRFAVVAARGSSSHAGTVLRYGLARRLGLVAAAAMPSVASVYGARQRMDGALFVAISQSGRSPDLLAQARAARDAGALSLALVNDAASPLAASCDLVVDVRAGPERSVAATKSVLATLAAGMAVIDAWTGTPTPALAHLPARLRAAAGLDWTAATASIAGCAHTFVLGRGPGLGIALEAALKLAETCGVPALAFSAAEFAHGPMTLAGPAFPVLAFLQSDATTPHSVEVLSGLAARGVPVLAAGAAVPGATALPTLPGEDPDCDLLPMLLSFYLAAEAAARARARDPDNPPGLSKVTRTV